MTTRRTPGVAVLAALAALAVPAADAQVYKCVDRAGRTTYQQQPCPDSQKGGRVELHVGPAPTRNDDDAELATRARLKEVGVGMARALVVQAWGPPQEMRRPRAGEDAAEVWVYRRTDLEARVGFRNSAVVWISHGSQDGAAAPAAAATSRQELAPGRACATLEADLGPADAIEEDFDLAVGRRVVSYRWAPTTADNETTVVVCDQGVIATVRHLPR